MKIAAFLAINVVLASSVHAQTPLERAAEHFDRGLTFFEEQRYDAALAEFSHAYELVPAPPTLYNLARVHAALGHAVEAADAYERYLREAGDLPARRRREAEQALEQQRARIGTLRLDLDVEGATVNLDGSDVATTPLAAPMSLSAGAHALELRASGFETMRISISIAGREELALELRMRQASERRGTLRVSASLPEVRVSIDGEEVGMTPLASTLPVRAGAHVVRAERPGYRTQEQRIEVDDGAEVELELEMRRVPDPAPNEIGRLRLRLPDAPHILRVDNEAMLGSEILLPIGTHDVEVEVTERRTYRGSVRVPSGGEIEIAPSLEWTLEARRARIDGASSQALNGIILTVTGGALAVASVAVLAWSQAELSRVDGRLVEVNSLYEEMGCRTGDFTAACNALRDEGNSLNGQQDVLGYVWPIALASGIIGLAVGGVGVGLWLGAPSEQQIDSAARASATLRLGPARLDLSGRF